MESKSTQKVFLNCNTLKMFIFNIQVDEINDGMIGKPIILKGVMVSNYNEKSLIITNSSIIITENIDMSDKYLNHEYTNVVCLSKKSESKCKILSNKLTNIQEVKMFELKFNEIQYFTVKVNVISFRKFKYFGCSTKTCLGAKLRNVESIGLSRCSRCGLDVKPFTFEIITVSINY